MEMMSIRDRHEELTRMNAVLQSESSRCLEEKKEQEVQCKSLKGDLESQLSSCRNEVIEEKEKILIQGLQDVQCKSLKDELLKLRDTESRCELKPLNKEQKLSEHEKVFLEFSINLPLAKS